MHPLINDLDEVDRAILDKLQHDANITNAALGRQLGLSPPAIHARLKRLNRNEFIDRTVALLDRRLLGYDLLCFVQVSLMLNEPDHVHTFRERVCQMPEVLECHHVTGEYDYLLKVVIRDHDDLEDFVVNQLTPLSGVARLQTSIVLTEIKAQTQLPIERNAA